MRTVWLQMAAVALGGVGCAAPPSVPPPQPVAWAQTPAEIGKLPVGRVLAVEVRNSYREVPLSAQQQRQLDVLPAVVPPSASPAALPLGYAMAAALNDLTEAPRGWYYRHRIQLLQSGDVVTRDERHTFKVGDCVALRESPRIVVRAMDEACVESGQSEVMRPDPQQAPSPATTAH